MISSSQRLLFQASRASARAFRNSNFSKRGFSLNASPSHTGSSLLILGAAAAVGVGAAAYWKKDELVVAAEADKLIKEGVPKELAAVAAAVQPTVITGTHPVGSFVTIRLSKNADPAQVAHVASQINKIVENLSSDDEKAVLPSLMVGIGFSSDVWDKIVQKKKLTKNKADFKFTSRSGNHGEMPATGGDILIHVKAETYSLAWEAVKNIVEAFPDGAIEKVDDWYGFQFQEGRDLSGFIDGTENPSDLKDRINAGVITKADDPNHAFGSYVIHQRWKHQLKPFHNLTPQDQEIVIGRAKPDSAVLDDSKSPLTSHVRRMKPNGKSVPIVRQSMPYGTYNDHGLLFIAYANTPEKFNQLLDRMIGKDSNEKHNDAVMSFSKCVASQYYYFPSANEIKSL